MKLALYLALASATATATTATLAARLAQPPLPGAKDTPSEVAAGRERATTRYVPTPASPSLANATAAYIAKLWATVPSNSTDCQAFLLGYEFALNLLPARAPLSHVFDALKLGVDCGLPPPPPAPDTPTLSPLNAGQLSAACTAPRGAFYVDATAGSDTNAGSEGAPFQSIPRALAATRAGRTTGTECIVLRGCTTFRHPRC